MQCKIETLNPCTYCSDPHCGLLDGQECERAETFRRVRKELRITRDYIHDHGLEWDLLSYMTRKEREERPRDNTTR